MRYLSVCSGIEAATVAWAPLGWAAAAFAEISPFPSAVLAHHYPDVPNLGDITRYREWPNVGPVQLLVGGTPCQSFSVAGLRGGLADPRGNLALVFLGIADALRPEWVVWENVPGVLSSLSHAAPDPCPPPPPVDLGRDGAEVETEDEYDSEELHAFNCFVAGLSELGYGVAYRVLDAQYFGLAQRRKRVFVVGCLGGWQRAAAVLFERDCLSGHPAPGRAAGQGTAASLTRGADSSGKGGYAGRRREDDVNLAVFQANGAGAERAGQPSLAASDDNGSNQVVLASTLRPPSHGAAWRGDGCDNLVAHALRGTGFDASEDGTGRGTPVAFDGQNLADCGDVSATLDSGASHTNRGMHIAFAQNTRDEVREIGGNIAGALAAEPGMKQQTYVAFHERRRDGGRDIEPQAELAFCLESSTHAGGGGRHQQIAGNMAVRRLTPTECERLQGFPDGYTLVPYRGKPASDGPRYQALGNSMATTVVRWIGERIEMVNRIPKGP